MSIEETRKLPAPRLNDPAENYHNASKVMQWNNGAVASLYTYELQRSSGGLSRFGRPTGVYGSTESTNLATEVESATSDDPVIRCHRQRYSASHFSGEAVPFQTFSDILRESSCISQETGRGVPSAGALYPIDIYVLVRSVTDLSEGLYALDPFQSSLRRLPTKTPITEFLQECLIHEKLALTLAFQVFFIGSFHRTRIKYGQRSYRFALLEAGHLAQSMILIGQHQGIASCPVGGFYDNQVDDLLGLDGIEQSVLYSASFGMPIYYSPEDSAAKESCE